MKRMNSITTILTATALFAGISTSAQADTGSVQVISANPSTLTVLNNGQNYTVLQNKGHVNVRVDFEFDTGTFGKIKSWWVQPKFENNFGIAHNVPGMQWYKQSKSYSVGNRPSEIDTILNVPVSVGAIKDAAVGMCNFKAAGLRNQGQSNNQIFAQDHEVSFRVSADFDVDAKGSGSNQQVFESMPDYILKVRCAKHSGPSIPQANGGYATNVEVMKATLQLQEVAPPSGACKIKTTTAISTNRANATIKYRFVHNTGHKSNVLTTKTKANKIAVVKHDWDIPNGPGKELGWVRIEGVSPKFQSNPAQYSMNCKGPSSGTGGYQKKPTTGKVKTLKLN